MQTIIPRFFALSAPSVLAFTCLTGQQPLMQWTFDGETVHGKELAPSIGTLNGKILGNAVLSKKPPSSLETTESFGGIILAEDHKTAGLPKKELTVSAWVRIHKPKEWGGILGAIQDNGAFERGWILGCGKNNFYFAVASAKTNRLTYLNSNTGYAPFSWYFAAGSYDGKLQRIYVDGKLAGESKVQSGPVLYPPVTKFALGTYVDDNEKHPFEGQMERVSLWDRALTPDEIERLYENHKGNFPDIETEQSENSSEDWPTFLHDNERSGKGHGTIRGKLSLEWSRQFRLAPEPAWPPPAKQDFWHKKYNLKPRVTFDRAFHVVGAEDRLYVASSADDQVRSLALEDGRLLWNFFAEAPIRLAPTLAGDRLLFGADDGIVRCLSSETGKLLWETSPQEIGSRRIPGNGRIIHERPIRTGILVNGQTAYFGAGLFPTQGTFLFSLDVKNGRILDEQKLSVSPQGYLSRKNGKLFAPTGRNLSGAFVGQLKRRGKPTSVPAIKIPEQFPFAFVRSNNLAFAGGDGKIGVFRSDGSLSQVLEIKGKAHSLAIIRGRILASTDQGLIYCFSSNANNPIHHAPSVNSGLQSRDELAERALRAISTTKGYCLIVGKGQAALAASIVIKSKLRVILCVKKDKDVGKLRETLVEAGLYGNKVVVHTLDSLDALPYAENIFNLLLDPENTLGKEETLRVLRPKDGIAFKGHGLEKVLTKAPVQGAGEWTHLYAEPGNTACSRDQRVAASLSLQWFGRPGPERLVDRHHRSVSPLYKNGFLFIPGNERIFGLDGYNGTVLWESEIPDSLRIAIMRDCGSMAVDDDFIYVASGSNCLALEVGTGRVDVRYTIPDKAMANTHEWGYVARAERLLLGSAVEKGGIRRQHGHDGIRETYWDNRPPVCSDLLYAMNLESGKAKWTYRPSKGGTIVNSSLAIDDGLVHFVESPIKSEKGRLSYEKIFEGGNANLVTLDLKTGKPVLRRQLPRKSGVQNLYVIATKGIVAVVNSRNDKTVRYDVRAYEASNGKLLWEQTQDNRLKINGSHGEQDRHPVVMNDELYVEPMIYNLRTGLPVERQLKRGRGCGALSASANALYFRSGNPTAYLPSTGKFSKITSVSRPGCWINAIPAGGMLLIPEASSGCTCAFPIQCSLAFAPKESSKK